MLVGGLQLTVIQGIIYVNTVKKDTVNEVAVLCEKPIVIWLNVGVIVQIL